MRLEYPPPSSPKNKRSIAASLLLGVLGLSVVIYPFAAMAAGMSLGGHWSGNESNLVIIVVKSFNYGILAYPIVLVPCYQLGRLFESKEMRRASIVMYALPILYLLLLAIVLRAIVIPVTSR